MYHYSATYDAMGRLTAIQDTGRTFTATVTNDWNGNITEVAERWGGGNPTVSTFSYDNENRLTEFTIGNSGFSADHTYDGFNRLIKTDATVGVNTQNFEHVYSKDLHIGSKEVTNPLQPVNGKVWRWGEGYGQEAIEAPQRSSASANPYYQLGDETNKGRRTYINNAVTAGDTDDDSRFAEWQHVNGAIVPTRVAIGIPSELFNAYNITLDADRSAFSYRYYALSLASTDLEYEGNRVKSPVIGRDMNPLGRGNGAYYPNGGNTAGGSIAINGAKPAFYGQTRCGYGTSINNQGVGGGGGGGDEWKGDQECDAPRPGDKCGRYCCVQVCTCPTLVLPPPKPPLDPNCPDCCDQVENCAQTGGPGFTAADCIKGNKGCIVLGSEYFTECEMKKGRAAKRIGDAEKGKHLGMHYRSDWPGKPRTYRTMVYNGDEGCYEWCMQKHNDPAYCKQVCAGMMPPKWRPRNLPYVVECPKSVIEHIMKAMEMICYDVCCNNCLDAADVSDEIKSCIKGFCNDCEIQEGKKVEIPFTMPRIRCWRNCTPGVGMFVHKPWDPFHEHGIVNICLSDTSGKPPNTTTEGYAQDLIHELAHVCDPGWLGRKTTAKSVENACLTYIPYSGG